MTPLGLSVINALQPDVVELRYDRAWSFVPLRVEVRGFRMRYQDDDVQLHLVADRGVLDVQPLASVARGQFVATRVIADGIELRLRQRLAKHDAAKERRLPPIPGLPSPLRSRPQRALPDDVVAALVGVDLTGMIASGIRELWIDEYHFTGDVFVRGGFMFQPFLRFRLDPSQVVVVHGALSLGDRPFASRIDALFEARAKEMNVSVFEREALRGLSVDGRVQANVKHVGFLNYYLSDVSDQVRLEEGRGRVGVQVRVVDGVVEAPSSLSLDTPQVLLRMPYFFATGGGKIRWNVREKKSWLDVSVTNVKIARESDQRVFVEGPMVKVLAQSSGLDLTKPLDLDVLLDLEEARATDLTFVNEFIPAGTGVTITSGAGVVKGHVEISASKRHARGALDIDGTKLGMRNKRAKLTGRLSVRGLLKDLDLRTRAADFSGSTIAVDDVIVENGFGDISKHFWLRVIAEPCTVAPTAEQKWRAGLGISFSSLWPVMGMIQNNVKVPWIVRAFSDLENVRAQVSLVVREDRLELSNIDIRSGVLRAQGDLAIVEVEKGQPQLPYGALLVSVGAIKAGVELDGKRSRGVLVNAQRWYEQRETGARGLR